MDNARSPSQIPVKRQISVEDDTSDRCNNTTAAQPRTPKIQAGRLQNHYAETLWNKQNVTSQVQLHTSPWLLLGKHTRTNVCAKPLQQRTTHHVQDGRPIAEFSLAATKQSKVELHDVITFLYWSVMTPLLVYWSE